jgi:predicted metal-binding membrane protein
VKLLLWRYPEWWTVALAGAAWAAIIAQAASASGVPHVHAAMMEGRFGYHGTGLYEWLLMTVAMMFPAMVGPAHGAAIRSLWTRRNRAIAMFLFGYLIVWMLMGVAISAALLSLGLNGRVFSIAMAFGAAAAWQLTPVKRWALKACHRAMPLAARGWRADYDCLRYGCAMGAYCIASCGALMLACSLAGHSLVPMISGTAIIIAERYFPWVSAGAIVAGISAVAGGYFAVAILSLR